MASVRSSYVQAYVDHQLAEQYVEHIDAQDDPALTEQVKEARSGLAAQLEQVPSALRPIFEDMASMSSYRSEEHTSELQSLMRISYAVFCLKKKHNITSNRVTSLKK